MYASKAFDRISVEDYLAGEKDADVRHEYVNGYVYAMAGSTPAHNIIAINIARAFGNALENRDCVVYASDMKIRASATVYYYPDVMVVCDNDLTLDYQNKPCVVVEVLSGSTARKDLHEKQLFYQSVETLELYLLVDSLSVQVVGHYRTEEGWEERLFEPGDTIPVPCVDTELSHPQIYAKAGLGE